MLNDVIDKLSEIESTAVSIMDNVKIRKSEMNARLEQNIQDYDKQIELQTEKKLESMKKNMKAEIQQEIEKLKSDTDKTIQHLEQEYQKNHIILAREILADLTNV